MSTVSEPLAARNAHIWRLAELEHYVEPPWVSEALFREEKFTGGVHDPCCDGWGKA